MSHSPTAAHRQTVATIDGEEEKDWVLEELVAGRVVNQITVDPATADWARVALQRMLDIS